MLEPLIWLCWLAPITGFFLAPVTVSRLRRLGLVIQPVYTFLSAISSAILASEVFRHGPIYLRVEWVPQLGLTLGFYIDSLSAIMINVVSWVALLIMIYSVKYMEHEPGLARFWMMMNLFVGGMLLLVISDNFIQMFVGWELVGVTSYSLIGHYYTDEEKYWVLNYPPTHCSMKAFIVTKIGDLFMLAGALIIYSSAGTLNFLELAEDTSWMHDLSSKGLLLPALLFLFMGPVGKSAQFPLHEWLPEAMAGPTPVSALIHAATMVKAGVYFVARILPLLHYAVWDLGYSEIVIFFYVVALVGAFTAFLAATQALVARELKRILAYSTISQLGYMILGLGVAGLLEDYSIGLAAAILHLINHALFKATLFLASGAIIHACETKNVLEMGGIRKDLRITFLCTLISALALAGVPPLSGFWSKDAILLNSMVSGQALPFLLGVVTSGLTAFYSIRMIGLVFFGDKSEHLKELEREGHHVHEMGPIVYIPYLLLTVLTLVMSVSSPLLEPIIHHAFYHESHHLSLTTYTIDGGGFEHLLVPLLSTVMVALGGSVSYVIYVTRGVSAELLVNKYALLKSMYQFLRNRWYINTTYYKLFVNGLLKLSSVTYSVLETSTLNRGNLLFTRFMLNLASTLRIGIEEAVFEGFNRRFTDFIKVYSGKLFTYVELATFEHFNISLSSLFKAAHYVVRKLQTGYLSYNLLEMIIGLVLLILLSVLVMSGGVGT